MLVWKSLLSSSAIAIVLGQQPAQAEEPSAETIAANAAVLESLPFETDQQDFDWAMRGFIATREDPKITDEDGRVIWDLSATEFLSGDAPDTTNPSLWRNARLMAVSGLFQSAKDVYQVRGFDLANVTFVRGETGWIVIDPLTSGETANAAFELLRKEIGDAPISAIVYTHSHGDHYGGSKAMMPYAKADIPIIAPAGFVEEAISENIIAGPAMRRRAMYHVGDPLALNAREKIGTGLGVGLAVGSFGMVPPNTLISETGEALTVDGVKMVFQMTSGTEAPAEFNIGFPDLGVVNIAENANPTHHNILTPRGAKVRDAKTWSKSLTEAIDMFDYADVLVVSHGWPVFGSEEIAEYLGFQRDAYAYLHDQTVRMMNQGQTLQEIADAFELPEVLAKKWYNRPYYGDYRFNTRAVYQFYLGWFDGNPVHLAPLPPEKAGQKYVTAMGGADAVLAMAQTSYDAGDYQWASELLNKLVFADDTNAPAKALLADTYEQMGWQEENALWRNFYLTGAYELRNGVRALPESNAMRSAETLAGIPTDAIFDVLSTQVNPERAGDLSLRLGFVFPDRDESFTLTLRNGVLIQQDKLLGDETYDVQLTANRADFLNAMRGEGGLQQAIASGAASLTGNPQALRQLAGVLDQPDPVFAIVTP